MCARACASGVVMSESVSTKDRICSESSLTRYASHYRIQYYNQHPSTIRAQSIPNTSHLLFVGHGKIGELPRLGGPSIAIEGLSLPSDSSAR